MKGATFLLVLVLLAIALAGEDHNRAMIEDVSSSSGAVR